MQKEDIIEFLNPNWKKLILSIATLIIGLILYLLSFLGYGGFSSGLGGSASLLGIFNVSFLYRDLLIIIILAYLLSCLLEYLSERFDNKWIFWIPTIIILILLVIFLIFTIKFTMFSKLIMINPPT